MRTSNGDVASRVSIICVKHDSGFLVVLSAYSTSKPSIAVLMPRGKSSVYHEAGYGRQSSAHRNLWSSDGNDQQAY
jgi:hypothetical protein